MKCFSLWGIILKLKVWCGCRLRQKQRQTKIWARQSGKEFFHSDGTYDNMTGQGDKKNLLLIFKRKDFRYNDALIATAWRKPRIYFTLIYNRYMCQVRSDLRNCRLDSLSLSVFHWLIWKLKYCSSSFIVTIFWVWRFEVCHHLLTILWKPRSENWKADY